MTKTIFRIQDMTSNTGRNYIDEFGDNCHFDNAITFDNRESAADYVINHFGDIDWAFIEEEEVSK
jgi:hypothetical protein